MDLSASLREAVDAALEGVALDELRRASDRLTVRYRSETRDGALHIADDLAARAYLAVRMPATYAAIRASFAAAAQLRPDFAPRSHARCRCRSRHGRVRRTRLLDERGECRIGGGEPCHPALGRAIAAAAFTRKRQLERARCHQDIGNAKTEQAHDLVVLGYLLDELPPPALAPLIERLWNATAGMLIAVEPGTPAGWSRILAGSRNR